MDVFARARWQVTHKHFRIDKSMLLPLIPLRINVDDRATHDLSQNQRNSKVAIQRQAYNRGGVAIDRQHHTVTVVHTTPGVVNAETATATTDPAAM